VGKPVKPEQNAHALVAATVSLFNSIVQISVHPHWAILWQPSFLWPTIILRKDEAFTDETGLALSNL
jgi:hypothetical protein